jgi:rhodanese-related sulfurtransferase
MTPIEVTVQDVDDLMRTNNEDYVLLDCREPDEAQTASIPGAMLLPMSNWNTFETQRSSLQGKRVIVHCHHGMRSLRVATWLRANGFPDAQSMAGGIDQWSKEIDMTVPRY